VPIIETDLEKKRLKPKKGLKSNEGKIIIGGIDNRAMDALENE